MVKKHTCDDKYVVELFKGITYIATFTYTDGDNIPIDLTNASIVVGYKTLFDPVLKLDSSGSPTPNGSNVSIPDPTSGVFTITLTDEETETAEQGVGRWWIELHDNSGNVTLLYRGDYTVSDV